MTGRRAIAQAKCRGRHEDAGFYASFVLSKGNVAGLHQVRSVFPSYLHPFCEIRQAVE